MQNLSRSGTQAAFRSHSAIFHYGALIIMYYTYIVRCADHTLYTGWTTDLKRRLALHNSGRGAKYTRSRRPVTLVYAELCETKKAAMSREWHIKKMRLEQKQLLLQNEEKNLLSSRKGDDRMEYQKILREIAAAYTAILQDNLVGIYIHGSIAFGCFNWSKSDIDFLVVVQKEPDLAEKKALIQTLLQLEPVCPPKGFEMSVVLRHCCENFIYPTSYVLHYSNIYKKRCQTDLDAYCREMNGTDADLAAHFTVTRAVGITLCGEEIQNVFGPVPSRYYEESIYKDSQNAEEDILKNPVYTILNLCRVLAYQKETLILSKKSGGLWALRTIPSSFSALVGQALHCYESDAAFSFDPKEMARFAAYMLAQLKKPEGDFQ